MSKQASELADMLRELFPHNIIVNEWYVKYKNQKLFFDIFIKDLGVLIEIQGKQHFEFVKHFHGSRSGFLEQKKRDNLKLEYVENNDKLCLVRFNYDEKIDKKYMLKEINKALKSEVGYV